MSEREAISEKSFASHLFHYPPINLAIASLFNLKCDTLQGAAIVSLARKG